MKKMILFYGMAACIAIAMAGCKGKPGYSGEEVSEKAGIVRERYMGAQATFLFVQDSGKWTLYGGPSAERIDMKHPLLAGEGNTEKLIPLDPDRRVYFYFVGENGTAIMAERKLPMDGGFNFRDLGGYRMKDGKHVKWGKFIRSDDLSTLSDRDLGYLATVPVKTIVDFRSQEEIEQAPDRVPPGATRYELSISPGDLGAAVSSLENLSAADLDGQMKKMNEEMVSDPRYVAQYREFFRLLQDEKNTGLLFHCSAGKDRTGMGAALILFALGADENTVMADYILSNEFIIDKYRNYISEYPQLLSLFSVKPEFLQAGIDRIKKDHGTVENFLENELGVNLTKFRRQYLD